MTTLARRCGAVACGLLLDRPAGEPLRYGPNVENRPLLGTGPRPTPVDVAAAVKIADRVERVLVAVLGVAWLLGARRGPR